MPASRRQVGSGPAGDMWSVAEGPKGRATEAYRPRDGVSSPRYARRERSDGSTYHILCRSIPSYPIVRTGITRTDGSATHSRSNELTKGREYYAEPVNSMPIRVHNCALYGFSPCGSTQTSTAIASWRRWTAFAVLQGKAPVSPRAFSLCIRETEPKGEGRKTATAQPAFGRRSPRAPRVHILCLSLYI